MKLQNAADIPFDDLKRQFFRESPKDVHGEFTWTNGYYWQWGLKKQSPALCHVSMILCLLWLRAIGENER